MAAKERRTTLQHIYVVVEACRDSYDMIGSGIDEWLDVSLVYSEDSYGVAPIEGEEGPGAVIFLCKY